MPYECQEHNCFASVRTRDKIKHICMHEKQNADFDIQKNVIHNNSRKRKRMKIADDNNDEIIRNSMIDDVSDAGEYEVEDDSHTLDNIDDDKNDNNNNENVIYPIDYNHSTAFLNEKNLEIHNIFKEERLKQSSISKIIKWYNKYHPSK